MTSFAPVRLAYVIREPFDGVDDRLAPVIFLHGATATKEYWGSIPQTVANRTKRKVYSLDARNHGDSEWSDVFSFDITSKDLLHFLDLKSISKAVLIGHSMGGVTCMQAAFQQPDRVEMVFIEDMFVKKVPQKILDTVVSLIHLFEEAVHQVPSGLDEEAANKSIMQHVFRSKVLTEAMFTIFTRALKQRKSNEVPKWITSRKGESKTNKKASSNLPLKLNDQGKYSLNYNSKILAETMKSAELIMSEPDGWYEGPVYFLYGTESPYNVNEDKPRILKHFPNAKLIGIEGAGHNVHLDSPEDFTEEVIKNLLKNVKKEL